MFILYSKALDKVSILLEVQGIGKKSKMVSRFIRKKCHGRQDNGPPKCPCPKPWTVYVCYLTQQRDFAGVMKLKDFEMRRLFWIMQVDPISSQGLLKLEEGGKREGLSDVV